MSRKGRKLSILELDNNREIAIYGTGYYANKVYWYLKYSNTLKKISFFVVTDGESKDNDFHGFPIFYLSEKVEELGNYQVIVAISPRKSESIISHLKEIAISNISMVTQDFVDNIDKELFRLCSRYPVKKNKILFDVNNGLGFMCNPKYIAKRLMDLDKNIELVWGITPAAIREFPERIRLVEREKEEFYYEIATAGIVVCNTTMNVPMIKHKSQYFINTWHGIGPFKRVGIKHDGFMDVSGWKESVLSWSSKIDLMIAASDHCCGVYRESLGYRGEIAKWGYPRNDVFFTDQEELRKKVCKRIGVDPEDSIVLYAPTYRVDIQMLHETGVEKKYDLKMGSVVSALESRYKKKFSSLYRLHQLIYRDSRNNADKYKNTGIDVTMYPDMMELLVAADVLITDWSSSIWDFSLARRQGKRVFLYQNDIERATELNGFYMPPDELPFPKGRTTEELCEAIRTYDDEQYMRDVDAFFEKYGSYDDGHASERVAERIIDVMEHPEKYGKVVACNIAYMDNLQFKSRRSVKWDKAEQIAKKYIGNSYCIEETSEIIVIGSDFPDEFCHSEERMKTRGANEKARANIVCVIGDMIRVASNKRTYPDYGNRHGKKAEYGWYRYDTRFAIPEYDNKEKPERYNIYRACMIVRHAADGKKYLYDFTRIKKEGVQPAKENLFGSKHRPSFETL